MTNEFNPTTSPQEIPSTETTDAAETSTPMFNNETEEFTPADLFINRELSWLEFNRRVLHEATDTRTPLLERVQFLSIFTSNLDEFYMKRVGGLKRQVEAGIASKSIDGLGPAEQITAIRQAVLPMLTSQAKCYRNDILPALQNENIFLLSWDELTPDEQTKAAKYFHERVFPVLTPLAVDIGHPFPFISNLSLSLAFVISPPGSKEPLFARVKIPSVLPRWINLNDPASSPSGYRFVNLVDLIRNNAQNLFHEMTIINTMLFRITRNADLEHDEEDAEDLLEMIAESLRQRRFAEVVRLEHEKNPNPEILQLLITELGISDEDVYEMPRLLDYTDLSQIAAIPLPEHHFIRWTPNIPPAFAGEEADLFNLIRQRDLLVHHPYESFDATVEQFIRNAADDPRVVAIKMTLYRTGDDSPFIKTLIRAAEAGKQVVCMVELQARFDEQRNIQCAQSLEKAGVHVVYGIAGLKTHSKTTLIVRDDPDGVLRCYAHIGTGNYHVPNARLYTDLGLFTANREITGDLVNLFHYLTGRSLMKDYKRLLVAPVNMREQFLNMIQQEINHKRNNKPAHIIAKMNSLQDRSIIHALYRASQAGVPVNLIVRGFCCLRPGVPGLSENINIISVIGRFLEHARIFHFRNGKENPVDGDFYIGSADWMYRNLIRRVEAVTPILAPNLRARLWNILQIQLRDHRQAWELNPDGSYKQRQPNSPDEESSTHLTLMRETYERHKREASH